MRVMREVSNLSGSRFPKQCPVRSNYEHFPFKVVLEGKLKCS